MQHLTETVETEGKKIGLQMNVKKCKTLVSDSWEDIWRTTVKKSVFYRIKNETTLVVCPK